MNENIYELALGMLPNVGNITAKSLVAHCGSAKEVFKAAKRNLIRIPGIGLKTASNILNGKELLLTAEKEWQETQKRNIQVLFYDQVGYPKRLKQCYDAPYVLFYKGNANLDTDKIIGIVGTRDCTEYGRKLVDELMKGLSKHKVLIVSGLAYGIDTESHKAAIKNQLSTIGVTGHGLDHCYPSANRSLALKMLDQGGLLTEYACATKPEPQNFPARNRIIAGLVDAVVVVEAAKKGGALITAGFANDYHRDVFAFPGNIHQPFSCGCNHLIKTNRASLLTGVEDLEYILNWSLDSNEKKEQPRLFPKLNDKELSIVRILEEHDHLHIDEISLKSNLGKGALASVLLNMEFNQIIKTLPGMRYQLG